MYFVIMYTFALHKREYSKVDSNLPSSFNLVQKSLYSQHLILKTPSARPDYVVPSTNNIQPIILRRTKTRHLSLYLSYHYISLIKYISLITISLLSLYLSYHYISLITISLSLSLYLSYHYISLITIYLLVLSLYLSPC